MTRRMTLLVLGLLAAGWLLQAALTLGWMRAHLLAALDAQLHRDVEAVALLLGTGDPPTRIALPHLREHGPGEPEPRLELWRPDGTRVAQDDPDRLAPDGLPAPGPVAGRAVYWTIAGLRVADEPAAGGTWIARSARPLAPLNEALGALLRTQLAIGALLGLVGAIGVRRAVRGALAPVRRLSTLLERLSADDLAQRAPSGTGDADLERMTDAFNALLQRLEDALALQREHTARAAHELRTPVAGLLASLQSALAACKDGFARERIGRALGRAEWMKELVDRLLYLARHETRRGPPLRNERTDLSECVERTAELLADGIERLRHRLDVDVPDDAVVDSDVTLTRTVLLNLLDNAVRHGDPREPIVVRGETSPDAVELRLVNAVRAGGAQLDRGRPGLGLGLRIAKACAAACGARLEWRAEEGRFVALLRYDRP